MLKQRVLTALALVAVLIITLLWSTTAFLVLSSAVFALALAEWLALAGWPRVASVALAALFAALMLAVALMAPGLVQMALLPASALAVILWCGIALMMILQDDVVTRPLPGSATTVIALLLATAAWLGLVHFVYAGPATLLSVLLIVWIADTAAYFAGRAWGKRRLAVHISPGKTWAGVFGAVVAVLLTAAVAWGSAPAAPWFTNRLFAVLGLLAIFPLILLVALSVVGDLYESLIKRQANVKDSGQMLPGHGGVYDRIDALFAVLPLAALLDGLLG